MTGGVCERPHQPVTSVRWLTASSFILRNTHEGDRGTETRASGTNLDPSFHITSTFGVISSQE